MRFYGTVLLVIIRIFQLACFDYSMPSLLLELGLPFFVLGSHSIFNKMVQLETDCCMKYLSEVICVCLRTKEGHNKVRI